MTKILFTSDWHAGCQQYGLQYRFDDFFLAIERIAKAIEIENPDIVIIGGDIFHKRQINAKTLVKVEKILNDIKQPVLAIYGNHDFPSSREGYGWLEYLNDTGTINLLNNEWYEYNGIRIYGFPFTTQNSDYEKLLELEGDILVGHFGVSGIVPFIDDVSQDFVKSLKFDTVLLGHIHKSFSILDDKCIGPGSTESTSFNEEGFQGGYWIIEPKHKKFVNIPRRELKTIHVNVNHPIKHDINKETIVRAVLTGSYEKQIKITDYVNISEDHIIIQDKRTRDQKKVDVSTEDEMVLEYFGDNAGIVSNIINRIRQGATEEDILNEFDLMEKLK